MNNQRVYVVSKIKHAPLWHFLRTVSKVPIISTWIDDGDETTVNFSEAWPRYLKEAASATHVLVWTLPGETLKGGLLEIGAALGAGASVILIENIPEQLRTAKQHPCIRVAKDVEEAVAILNSERYIVGIAGQRDPEFPCTEFAGESLMAVMPQCPGDGHYMCRECIHFKPAEISEA